MLAQTFLRALAPFTFAALAFAVDHPWSDTCENYQSELTRRDTTSVGAGASVGADVSVSTAGCRSRTVFSCISRGSCRQSGCPSETSRQRSGTSI
jgi:hypothetical protein